MHVLMVVTLFLIGHPYATFNPDPTVKKWLDVEYGFTLASAPHEPLPGPMLGPADIQMVCSNGPSILFNP